MHKLGSGANLTVVLAIVVLGCCGPSNALPSFSCIGNGRDGFFCSFSNNPYGVTFMGQFVPNEGDHIIGLGGPTFSFGTVGSSLVVLFRLKKAALEDFEKRQKDLLVEGTSFTADTAKKQLGDDIDSFIAVQKQKKVRDLSYQQQ
jgi:hypothetical protein